jgi:DNA helicase-2/ATP-dependent DNA helicase PcrA
LFDALHPVDRLNTGFLDGSLSGLRFFSQLILPLANAREIGDSFSIARIVRQNSPLLSREALKESKNQKQHLINVKKIVDGLLSKWTDDNEPKLIEVLHYVAENNLFSIPDSLLPIALRDSEEQNLAATKLFEEEDNIDDPRDEIIEAWDRALNAPFCELRVYFLYVSNLAKFGTHQGVKGLEFDRVMVIIDDKESRGFMFKYEKLFGAEPLSRTDRENIEAGRESAVDRARRLLYVTCSRAEKSLAIVAYTANPSAVKQKVISSGWFEENEIVTL